MIYSNVIVSKVARYLGIGGWLMSQSYLCFFHIVFWKLFFLDTKILDMASYCFSSFPTQILIIKSNDESSNFLLSFEVTDVPPPVSCLTRGCAPVYRGTGTHAWSSADVCIFHIPYHSATVRQVASTLLFCGVFCSHTDGV